MYLMRELTHLKDTSLFEMCARLLTGHSSGDVGWEGGHCEPTIAKLSRFYGFHSYLDLRLAFRSGCLSALVQAIHEGREKRAFWEERFGKAFKTKCIDVAKSLRRPANRDLEAAVAREDSVDVDDCDSGLPLIDATVADRLSKPHNEAVVLQAVRLLPLRQSRAVFLAYVEQRPIEGVSDSTVADIMGITPRAVYKLLEKALKTLRKNPDLRAIWQEEA